MPTNLPSSFASAAAGQNATRGGRGDGRGSAGGDWSRRDGRSTNGTLTFRRSSTTPLSQTSQHPPTSESLGHAHYSESSSLDSAHHEVSPARYSKEELLDMYNQRQAHDDPSRLFMQGWNPGSVNGGSSRAWGKSNENHVPQEPGACWNVDGGSQPVGLSSYTEDEREAFSTDINSPLKPPVQQGKDGGIAPGTNGRKTSISHGAGNTFGLSSPLSATRPGNRRRETTDSNPFSAALASPSANRASRDEWLPRKSNEPKETDAEVLEPQSAVESTNKLPFSLMRSNTTNNASFSSIWGQSNPSSPGAGAFGSFALGAGGNERAGSSRLAHLMPKEGSDNAPGRPGEGQASTNQSSWRTRARTDTDPFGEDMPSGSAALGGSQDTTAVPPSVGRIGALGTPVKGSTGDFGMSGLNLGGYHDDNGPLSPSETNPFRSPAGADRHDDDGEGAKGQQGFGQEPGTAYNPLQQRGFATGAFDGSDRSQTSSVGAKGFLGHGPMSGWAAPGGPSVATPDRERPNFTSGFPSLFGGDLQSPGGLGNLNNVFGTGSAGGLGHGSIGRGSKLGSLFPAAMQAQMGSHDSMGESNPDIRQTNPLGAIGRSNFSIPTPDVVESPMRANRGVFEELFPSPAPGDGNRSQSAFGNADQPSGAVGALQSFTPTTGGMAFGGNPALELASAQARTMVMPDRMRWVYLDPQANIQGPFTGLEMNDWYKAQFFSPDLRVKKVEDPEFEPLGQLIRRIGNSREPFLVPQIGIPHGLPTGGAYTTPTTGGGVVPPLSGVFPSFGRTLTAEEQNNLERRKQEEQFMVAQQREFMMRQQAISRFQPQGPGLHHHASAHSLHSQPSFGNISSPVDLHQGQQPQPIGAIAGGFFDSQTEPIGQGNGPVGLGNGGQFQEEDFANLSPTERQMLSDFQHNGPNQPPIGALASDSARVGLPETQDLERDEEGFADRLQQFEDLRAQRDAEQMGITVAEIGAGELAAVEVSGPAKKTKGKRRILLDDALALSLTQQVQNTQAAAAAALDPEPDMPMPFPPPTSTTPLPAPTAQRARSNLPEQYSLSRSGSSDDESDPAAPPPLAPWAKEPGNDGPKGPSLKEIQEAEARKAARAEEAAAAMRKAALEQEAVLLREREKAAVAQAAGLPASSTWGHTASPVASVSPWSKPSSVATPIAAGPSTSKKTLADIQREEERRKVKALQTAVQTGVPVPITSKSYANLAGKPGQSPIPGVPSPAAVAVPVGPGWATVGAGGKVKVPTGPAALTRSVSATVKPATVAVPSPVVKPVSRPVVPVNKGEGDVAMDEFRKWVNRELSRGITGVNDLALFQASLDILPLDHSIIADAIYSNSTTMDGRHFADEFIRRKRLAEKGVISAASTDGKTPGSTGGWSEVAKKTTAPPKESSGSESIANAGFRVVAGRKKSKK